MRQDPDTLCAFEDCSVVHCLEGRIAFTSGTTTRELGPGQMILLAAGEPHLVAALDDATVLVTKAVATH